MYDKCLPVCLVNNLLSIFFIPCFPCTLLLFCMLSYCMLPPKKLLQSLNDTSIPIFSIWRPTPSAPPLVHLLLKVSSHHCFLQLADNASWRGTPGEYVVVCKYYLLTLGSLPNCEYHVDATSNRVVLQKLGSAKSYLVYIKMCNKENVCGPGSEPHIIEKIQGGSRMCVCLLVGGGD